MTPQRRELRTAWARALPKISLNGVHWERVTGPTQATMAMIAQIDWHTVAPDKWMDTEKENLAELEWSPFANAGILEAMSVAIEKSTWK